MERDLTDIVKEREEEDAILAGLEQEHMEGRHEGSIFVTCPLCASEKS